MSDNIPFEVQTEIIQRIPDTKSLIRYRSVSKAWKSVIDSNKFVKAHTLRHHQAHNRHHLLIKTLDCSNCKDCTGDIPISQHCDHCNYTPVKYYSILDDDDDDVTFPRHQKDISRVFVPDLVDEFSRRSIYRYDSEILGSCHGLFCLYEPENDTAIIWNPFIRKTFAIPVLNECERYYMTVVGFGVCPRDFDPKLVKITYVYDFSELQDVNDASTQVEVFALSSGGTWRSPLSNNIPHKSIQFGYYKAVVGRFIYWDAVDRINNTDVGASVIMSFDLTSEEFTKVNLPDCLTLHNPDTHFSLFNLRESLAVLVYKLNSEFGREDYNVWMMRGHGCTRSFDKLYSINAPIHSTLGCRKSGAPIIEVDNDKEDYYRHERALAIYEPKSESISYIGVYGLRRTFYVNSYKETLLLHGH